MKKPVVLFILLINWNFGIAQKVKHNAYTTYYNRELKIPDSVSWDLRPDMLNCIKPDRKEIFAPDPDITGCAKPGDYAGTGLHKGHLFNWDDAACNTTDIRECFFMSNMLPQEGRFNTGDWKTLENRERIWAKEGKIHIVAGGLGSKGKLRNGENIPAFFWKAIYRNHTWSGWIMPNLDTSYGHDFTYWKYDNIATFFRQAHFHPETLRI